mmetsp:Transcript_7018/g.12500  ORF Transcript_7018/g.12500 Transcript_7018/m.12500 type:complete len:839 (+) Transcript_7018:789-3305(+)|eukprot:CAMPEP_0203747662 /NCGR_PEP_ID=MMETSP0098-20131031/2746_1 /ASSEMBLY_ACC=CAM_ASM_000208 /TAXON_ID=96639 /ORGANISM=" , Strain NY0313808BC1" /LENGTH=838 /DNA_ID=CAMNT_0050636153 /DNA_START=1244 /DNA_END=3760 /DNA_ORIENTATION=+
MEDWVKAFPFENDGFICPALDEGTVVKIGRQLLGDRVVDLKSIPGEASKLLDVPKDALERYVTDGGSNCESLAILLLGSAVKSAKKDKYIGRILELETSVQVVLKQNIEDLFSHIRSNMKSGPDTPQLRLVSEERKENLKSRIHKIIKEKIDLEQSLGDSENTIKELKLELAILKEREGKYNRQLESLGESLTTLSAQVDEMDQLRYSLQRYRGVAEEAQRRADENKCKMEELEIKCKNMDGLTSRLYEDEQNLRLALKEKSAELERALVKSEMRDASTHCGETCLVEPANNEANEMMGKFRSKVSNLEKLNSTLDAQIQQLDVENKELMKQLAFEKEAHTASKAQAEEEISEWSEYANKLEREQESHGEQTRVFEETTLALDSLHKMHQGLRHDTEREIDFWTRKLEEEHDSNQVLHAEKDLLKQKIVAISERVAMQHEEVLVYQNKCKQSGQVDRARVDDLLVELTKKSTKVRHLQGICTAQLEKIRSLRARRVFEEAARTAVFQAYEKYKREFSRAVDCAVENRLAEFGEKELGGMTQLVNSILKTTPEKKTKPLEKLNANLNAMVRGLVATPDRNQVDMAYVGKLKRAVRRLQDNSKRLQRENAWLQQQFNREDSVQHIEDFLEQQQLEVQDTTGRMLVCNICRDGSGLVSNEQQDVLREAVLHLEAENRVLSQSKTEEIQKRLEAQFKLHELSKEIDRLRLRSTNASSKLVREKRGKSDEVQSWFTIKPLPLQDATNTTISNSTSFISGGSDDQKENNFTSAKLHTKNASICSGTIRNRSPNDHILPRTRNCYASTVDSSSDGFLPNEDSSTDCFWFDEENTTNEETQRSSSL